MLLQASQSYATSSGQSTLPTDINYVWNFNPLESYPTASGETDVVFMIHWQLYGKTGSYQASSIGVQPVNYTGDSPFIPFNELTYDIVYNWMTASMGIENMNQVTASVALKIQNLITPSIITQEAPWLNTGSASIT